MFDLSDIQKQFDRPGKIKPVFSEIVSLTKQCIKIVKTADQRAKL